MSESIRRKVSVYGVRHTFKNLNGDLLVVVEACENTSESALTYFDS